MWTHDVGESDGDFGAEAFVVLSAGSKAHEESLITWCLDHLARYKCPSKVLFVDELPRNANGKVVRRSLV